MTTKEQMEHLSDARCWDLVAELGRETARLVQHDAYIGGDIVRDAQWALTHWDRRSPFTVRVRAYGTWIAWCRDTLPRDRDDYAFLLVTPDGVRRVSYGKALCALPETYTQPRRVPRERDDRAIAEARSKARAFADANGSRSSLEDCLARVWSLGCNMGSLDLRWNDGWQELGFRAGGLVGGVICHRDTDNPHWSIHT